MYILNIYVNIYKTYQISIYNHIDINHINYRNKELHELKMILFSVMRKNEH